MSVRVLNPLQTLVPVPDTVYTVVAEGLTVTLLELDVGAIQVYVLAPLTVIVLFIPGHTEAGEAAKTKVGEARVEMVATGEKANKDLHPLVAVPYTVYVVLTRGDSVADPALATTVPEGNPLNVYELAPLAVITKELFGQIEAALADKDTVGFVNEVRLTVFVSKAQPAVPQPYTV